jgi:hypothetical protein
MDPLQRRSVGRRILCGEPSVRKGGISSNVKLVVEITLFEALVGEVAGLCNVHKGLGVAAALDIDEESH